MNKDGVCWNHTPEGLVCDDKTYSPVDLIEVTEPLHLWANVASRKPFVADFHESREEAERYSGPQDEPTILEFVEVVKQPLDKPD